MDNTEGVGVFSLLSVVAMDDESARVFSRGATIEYWLAFERALARAQARLGIVDVAVARALDRVTLEDLDLDRIWADSHTVGYPILPLIRQLDSIVEPEARGKVHLGATTQDVMDTALALQMSAVLDRLTELIVVAGDRLSELVATHSRTPMAGRTHGQQAVPTTLGAVLAPSVAELGRHLERIRSARPRIARVSMYGAAGTSAAYGPRASELRELVASELGLGADVVPWHSTRDTVAEFGFICAAIAATIGRLGRAVIDLARTEIGELGEPSAHHRGASSAMPQKANPITSEAAVGTAIATSGMVAGLLNAMLVPQERAAGEWQAEWELVPRVAVLSCASAREMTGVLDGLVVHADRMRENLELDGGLILAEAYMMALSGRLGRERAHDAVYEAAVTAKAQAVSLHSALRADKALRGLVGARPLEVASYLGNVDLVCAEAVAQWKELRRISVDGRALP